MKHHSFIKLRDLLIVTLIMLWAVGLWGTRISQPFTGRHDNNAIWVVMLAENYQAYGAVNLNFVQYTNRDFSLDEPDPRTINHSHPPLITLYTSLALTLFGDAHMSARVGAMFLSLLMAACIYRFTVDVLNNRFAATVALLFTLTSPVIAFYGQMLGHEIIVMLLYSALLMAYWRYSRRSSTPLLATIGLFSALIVFAGWGGYICAGFVWLHALFYRRWQMLIVMALAVIAGSLLWIIPSLMAGVGFVETMQNKFLTRTGQTDVAWSSPLDFAWTMIWARVRIRFTEVLMILSGGGFLLASWRAWGGQSRHDNTLLASLILPPIAYILLLSEQSYRHDYITYYFVIAFAVLASVVVLALYQQIKMREGVLQQGLIALSILLVIGYTASTFRWTRNIYMTTDDLPIVGGAYLANLPDDVTVYGNFDFATALEYYAERNIIPTRAITDEDNAVILTCEWRQGEEYAFVTSELGCFLTSPDGERID